MFSRLPSPGGGGVAGDRPGTPALEAGPAQPCPAHRLACTIYRDRPGACRHYECALLKRHIAGLVDDAEAAEVVFRARTLRDRARAGIESVIGAYAGLGLNDLAGQFSALVHGNEHLLADPAHTHARESLSALDDILSRHFHASPGAGEGTTST